MFNDPKYDPELHAGVDTMTDIKIKKWKSLMFLDKKSISEQAEEWLERTKPPKAPAQKKKKGGADTTVNGIKVERPMEESELGKKIKLEEDKMEF